MEENIEFINFKRLEENDALESARKEDQSEDNTNDAASTPIETEILAPATECAKNEDQSHGTSNDVASTPIETEILAPAIESVKNEDQSEDTSNDVASTPIETEILASATERVKNEDRLESNTNNVAPKPTEREIRPGCSSWNDESDNENKKRPKFTSIHYVNSKVTRIHINCDGSEVSMQDTCENKKSDDETNGEIPKFTSTIHLNSEDETNGEIPQFTSTMHLHSDETEVPMSENNIIKILPESAVEETPIKPIRRKNRLQRTVIEVPSEPAIAQPVAEQVSEDDEAATNTANEVIVSKCRECRRPPCFINLIITIGVIALAVISTIAIFHCPSAEVPSAVSIPQALFMQSGREIWTVDPRNLSCHLLMQQSLKQELIAFDVYKNKTMLWLERNTTTIKSLLKQNMNVTYPRQWNPRGVALDFVTEKLYVIDELAEVLYVLDVKRNHHGVVLSDLKQPIDIVLDPPRGFMFIVQKNDSILRANMDGSSRSEIFTNQSVSAITIDRKTRKLYWIEHENNVISSNYDGSNQTKVLELAYAYVNSLTVYNDQLYCLSSNRIQAHQHSIVLFCKIDSGTCVNLMERKMPFYSSTIRAPSELVSKPVVNPCEEDNGGCEHMCLLKATGGSNCACQTGWQLKGDTGSCEPIDRYILYSQGNYFRGRVVDPTKETFVEVITPTWFHMGPVKIRDRRRETVSFDRGWDSSEVFLNNDHSIYRLSLDDGHQSLLKEVKNTYQIEALAVDRMSRNVYYLQVSKFSNSHAIKAITLKNNEVLVKTVTHITFGKDVVGLTPDSLVTHPYRSQLFYRIHTSSTKLTSIYPSTTRPQVYAQLKDSADDGSITVDARDDRTYWVDKVSHYGVMIAYAAWSNGDVESFDIESDAFSGEPQFRYSLSAHNKTLYVSDFHFVWSIDKNYGKNMTRLFPNIERHAAGIAGVKFINSLDFERARRSECMVDNGGCEEFCFLEETTVCDCQDKYEVERDGSCRYNAIRSAWVSWNYTIAGNGSV